MTKFIKITCAYCKGKGTVEVYFEKRVAGRLKYIPGTDKCPSCKGSGKKEIRV